MCQDNTSTRFCGHSIAPYIATKAQNRKPQVKFCPQVSGIILLELLSQARSNTTPTDKPEFHVTVSDSHDIRTKCRVVHEHHSYRTIIIPAFKNHVKWIQTKARLAGVLVRKDGCWVVEEGCSVKNEGEAVALCDQILSHEATSVSRVGTAKPLMSSESVASDRFARESRRSDFDHVPRDISGRDTVKAWMEGQQEQRKSTVQAKMEALADEQMEHLLRARELDQQLVNMWKEDLGS
ncbi:hypothetical protein ACHAP5_011132 [Fusarium lateritium]